LKQQAKSNLDAKERESDRQSSFRLEEQIKLLKKQISAQSKESNHQTSNQPNAQGQIVLEKENC
jgi:hypothetical protein